MIETNRALRDHNFLPDDLSSVPRLYETEEVEADEKVIHLHFLIPERGQAFDWWIAEYNTEDDLAFGYSCLNGDTMNAEWGYISLTELEELLATRPRPILVVRDTGFKPQPWKEVLASWKRS